MKICTFSAALVGVSVLLMFGLGAQAADGPCSGKRLDWMLDEEKCGDLVFADVIEIMHICDDEQMRSRAAEGLGRYRGPEVFTALYRVLERDRSPMVRAAAIHALDSIMQRTEMRPGRESMETCFFVYQFDRYAPNRARARELLERAGACPKMLKERAYVSARYTALFPLDVYASATMKSAAIAALRPGEHFTITDESGGNNKKTCWFTVETPSGIKGWICGLQDFKEYISTDDAPPRPFESSVRSLTEINNPAQAVALELRTSRPNATFRPGDEIAFFVKADQDCFVTLIYFSPQSGGYILFPNRDQKETGMRAGTEVRIPADGSTLVIKASAPGADEISVIATRMPLEIFASQDVEQGPFCTIKTGPQETARTIDRLLRYFKADSWAIAHTAITTLE